MARKLQIKRGPQANLPRLSEGELGLTTDNKKVYIGHTDGNIELLTINTELRHYWSFGSVQTGFTRNTPILDVINTMKSHSVLRAAVDGENSIYPFTYGSLVIYKGYSSDYATLEFVKLGSTSVGNTSENTRWIANARSANFSGWKEVATTDKIDILSTDLLNGWGQLTYNVTTTVSKSGNEVKLTGWLTVGNITNDTVIFNIPYHPSNLRLISVSCSDGKNRQLNVGTNGDVVVDNSFIAWSNGLNVLLDSGFVI